MQRLGIISRTCMLFLGVALSPWARTLLAGYSESGANGDKSEAGRGSYDYWAIKIDANGNK